MRLDNGASGPRDNCGRPSLIPRQLPASPMLVFPRWAEHAVDVAVQRPHDTDARETSLTRHVLRPTRELHRCLPLIGIVFFLRQFGGAMCVAQCDHFLPPGNSIGSVNGRSHDTARPYRSGHKKDKASEIALRGLTRPLGVHPPARPLWRQYWHANCVGQSQRLGSGASRTFFAASARSIAFSAAATASILTGCWPDITTPETDADHFQTPRSMP